MHKTLQCFLWYICPLLWLCIIFLNFHKKIFLEDSKKLINKTFDVLVEGYKNDKTLLKGRTTCNRKVVFKAPTNLAEPIQIGSTKKIKIIDVNHQTLIGSI